MIDKLKFLVSPHPTYMIFWVTGACNLSCSHCFNRSFQSRCGKDLTLGEVDAISRNMAHVKYLTLAGGEPLLRKDLSAIVRVFYKNNDLHMVNLVTNGWYTDRAQAFVAQTLKACPDLHISVGVSLDGPQDIHDHFRGREGSFRRAVETLKTLKQMAASKRLTLAACGTCHAGNITHLPGLAQYVQDKLGIPYYAGLIRGEALPDMGLKAVDPDDYKDLSRGIGFKGNVKLAPHYPFRHLRIAVDQMVEEIIYKSLKYNKKTVSCKAGKKGFVLTSDGGILLCEILDKHLGNVRDHQYDPYAVLNRPFSLEAMAEIRSSGCHCTWECFQRLNVVFSPKVYFRLGVHFLKTIASE
ncbi:MAG: radical SAM protein [Proteobacteria bacterium]|nr:radical SAM protein [Pseudomonadota bacterium]